jgi:hypothetical protein
VIILQDEVIRFLFGSLEPKREHQLGCSTYGNMDRNVQVVIPMAIKPPNTMLVTLTDWNIYICLGVSEVRAFPAFKLSPLAYMQFRRLVFHAAL